MITPHHTMTELRHVMATPHYIMMKPHNVMTKPQYITTQLKYKVTKLHHITIKRHHLQITDHIRKLWLSILPSSSQNLAAKCASKIKPYPLLHPQIWNSQQFTASARKHTEYLYPVVHKTSLQNMQAKTNPNLFSTRKFGTHNSSLQVLANTLSISTQ